MFMIDKKKKKVPVAIESNILNRYIVVSVIKHHSCNYVLFLTNTLEEDKNFLTPSIRVALE